MAGYWPNSFSLCVYGPKRSLRPKTRESLVNKGFIIWRSGLPAVSRKQNYPESHIINPLLTKFVRSRWLDIGLVLFLRVYGPRLRLGP